MADFRTIRMAVDAETLIKELRLQHVASKCQLFVQAPDSSSFPEYCTMRGPEDLQAMMSPQWKGVIQSSDVVGFGHGDGVVVQLLPSGKLIVVTSADVYTTFGLLGTKRPHTVEGLRGEVFETVIDLLTDTTSPAGAPTGPIIKAALGRLPPVEWTVATPAPAPAPFPAPTPPVVSTTTIPGALTWDTMDDMPGLIDGMAGGRVPGDGAVRRLVMEGLTAGLLMAPLVEGFVKDGRRFVLTITQPNNIPYAVHACRHPVGSGGVASRVYAGPGGDGCYVVHTTVCKRDEYT